MDRLLEKLNCYLVSTGIATGSARLSLARGRGTVSRLKRSKGLGRMIRQDEVVSQLAIPTWTLVHEAIRAGNIDEGLALMDYERSINKQLHDSMVQFADDVLTHLSKFGEEEIYQVFRKRYYPKVVGLLKAVPGVKEYLQSSVETHRAHGGNLTVAEEPDRYVVTCNPCGSGGMLRLARNVATFKKPAPWTWNEGGVPYYCANCCVMCEILPIELRGYPLRVHQLGKKPGDPCIHLFYKKPELIPEEYFTRVGKTKTIK